MGQTTVTEVETVEKEKTVLVCDSCGTQGNELPEGYEMHTVYENIDLSKKSDSNAERRVLRDFISTGVGATTHVAVEADESHLCGICYGAVFGSEKE